jgi:phosphotriesterase-related protein
MDAGPGRTGHVMTVEGPIDPADLGVTLPHEHLLVDATVYWDPAGTDEASNPDRPVEMPLLGRLRRDPVGVTRDNLRIDDPVLVAEELRAFVAAGGRSLVDLTARGAGLNAPGVLALARTTGVQVVLGTAFYLDRTLPAWVRSWSVDEIADLFARDIEQGFEGVEGCRAGIIGEIGTTERFPEMEERVLRAAARAQRRTGVPLAIHLEEWGSNGHRMLDIVAEEGGDPSRTALCHLDSRLDLDYHRSLAARGAYVSYDLWGTEEYRIRERRGNPSDTERTRAVRALVDDGLGAQILVSTDVCTKAQLLRYGGYGYAHVLTNAVPMLRDVGLDETGISQLLVDNPRRLLTIGG